MINIDDALMGAVDELRALIAEQSDTGSPDGSSHRPESTLSVREVQARLRRGRSIEQVAREAGVDSTWIARFAAPVLAEQSEIIRTARATRMVKQRVGLSGAPLGDCVYRNLADRGVSEPRDELDKGWRAKQLSDDVWLVSFRYSSRGRESVAEWEYDETTGALRSRGRLGTQLGFREGRRSSRTTSAATATADRGAAKKSGRNAPAKRATTARQSSSRQASKRVAAARRAAAARLESEAEKATRRDAALARKAAKKPVLLPPRRFEPPPPRPPEPEPDELEVEEELDADLDLETETDLEHEPELDLELDLEVEFEPEPEPWVDDLDAGDVLRWPVDELDAPAPARREADASDRADTLHVAPERPAPESRPPASRRREPLRSQGGSSARDAEQLRQRVRVRTIAITDEGDANGPVFRNDLVQTAGEEHPGPRGTTSTPELPLPAPMAPIEPPPRRRRLRPLRGR